jgi:hypothetical protein
MSMSVPLKNPERINANLIGSPGNRFYGLSPYEYANTIEGRMASRSNNHIAFEKQTINRPPNENPIHYNRNEDLNFSYSQVMR